MTAIGLDAVTKVFDDGTVAVDSLSLEIAAGEFVVLLGPSGCGKSTALRMIAGLETITTGRLRIGHRVANDLAPQDRGVAMVFQTFALYPQMTVHDNIAFPLQMAKVPPAEIEERVAEVAETLGIGGLLERYPAQMSGGQRQRAAMGRALVRRPTAFLMDEPLSNLDAGLRAELRAEIVALARDLEATTLYVTHDQTEAMTMADRVAVLRSGVLEQVGHPQQVYDDPATLFVAAFLGTPRMNLFEAEVQAYLDDRVVLGVGEQELSVPWASARARPLSRYHNGRVVVGVRPEALTLGYGDGDDLDTLRGRVRHVENHGYETLAHVDIGSTPVARRLLSTRRESVAVPRPRRALDRIRSSPARRRSSLDLMDQQVDVSDPAHAYRTADLVLRLPARSTVSPGDHVPIRLDMDRLHLFDAQTGRALPAYFL